MTHRPCGACGELVDPTIGCPHWRPAKTRRPAAAVESRTKTRVDVARREAAHQAWLARQASAVLESQSQTPPPQEDTNAAQ